jgi:hypothetical protein
MILGEVDTERQSNASTPGRALVRLPSGDDLLVAHGRRAARRTLASCPFQVGWPA